MGLPCSNLPVRKSSFIFSKPGKRNLRYVGILTTDQYTLGESHKAMLFLEYCYLSKVQVIREKFYCMWYQGVSSDCAVTSTDDRSRPATFLPCFWPGIILRCTHLSGGPRLQKLINIVQLALSMALALSSCPSRRWPGMLIYFYNVSVLLRSPIYLLLDRCVWRKCWRTS